MKAFFDNHHVRRILDCGEIVGMQVHPLKDKKPVYEGMGAMIRAALDLEPDRWRDGEYWPDPSKDDLSEFNAMTMLVRAGFYERTHYSRYDSDRWEWRATAEGRKLIKEYRALGFAPERNPHESVVTA